MRLRRNAHFLKTNCHLAVCERVEILPVRLGEVLHLAAEEPVEVLRVVSVGGVGDSEQGLVN